MSPFNVKSFLGLGMLVNVVNSKNWKQNHWRHVQTSFWKKNGHNVAKVQSSFLGIHHI